MFQLPCPEMEISHISRLPLPKESYDNPAVRKKYRGIAKQVVSRLKQFADEGYKIVAVVGAEASPTCGISLVGRWKDPKKRGKFPDDVEFVEGMGVFMEEFKRELEEAGIHTAWIGMPGKSLRSIDPETYSKEGTIEKIREIIRRA